MSFVTTQTEEMLAAETLLSGINSNLAAQNAGAASATTVIAPAAADPVSAQQAAIFSAYGTQYQTIAAEAQALLEQYSQTLGVSSNSYGDTEAVNASQAAIQALDAADTGTSSGAGSNPFDIFAWLLGYNGQSSGGLGGMFGLSSNTANIGNIGIGNWSSATSNLLGLAGGGLLDTSADAGAAAAADLATTTTPAGVGVAGVAGVGAMPAAAMGQATMVNKPRCRRVGPVPPRLRGRAPRRCRRSAGPPPRPRPVRERWCRACPGSARWGATAPASAHRATASSRS